MTLKEAEIVKKFLKDWGERVFRDIAFQPPEVLGETLRSHFEALPARFECEIKARGLVRES